VGCGLLDVLVCADSQEGPFRRSSTPHDREPFARQRMIWRNRQDSVLEVPQVRSPVLIVYHAGDDWARLSAVTTREKPAEPLLFKRRGEPRVLFGQAAAGAQ